MKRHHTLFEKGDLRWTVLYKDPKKKKDVLDSNEYLVSVGDEHFLLDPGGFEVFPTVLSTLVQIVEPEKIKAVFSSHQDPDIASSLTLWQEINPDIRCYVSWLWCTFMPHFGGTDETFIPIPDKGMDIMIGGKKFEAIPAHHLHSAGNMHFYDPESKIYFSGDIGAAFVTDEKRSLFFDDFEAHIPNIEGFHRRWLGSNEHKNQWCERVSEMDIEVMCPQHGMIYRGDQVKSFIDWLSKLNVGTTSNTGFQA